MLTLLCIHDIQYNKEETQKLPTTFLHSILVTLISIKFNWFQHYKII